MFFYTTKVIYEDYVDIEPIVILDDKIIAKLEEISCYDKDDRSIFLSTEDPTFSPPPKDKSIFFIEAACKEEMSMLHACVIESAAVAHPESKIYVLFSYSITESQIKGYFGKLLSYPNIFAARIHITQYAKGTALESILVKDIKKTRHPIEDITNVLKLVTLHKWGGTVLSSDMMVIRSFEDLPKNWIAKKNNAASSKILSLAKDDVGTNITNEIIKEFAKTYDTKSRYVNRLETTLIRVLKRRCSDIFTSKSGECNGFKVFKEDFFFPIRIPSPAPYADEGTESDEEEMPYTFHIKNMDFSSYPSEEWPSEDLARIFCPSIFEFKLKIN
ncbi:hypothetical protein PYW07_001816 [Mythimna separata]|uniref:Alpha 1,4-glycosyltransferase domain-containing protein n=1 Tax=Mythimna separata TaxID=271217 RepID=A0AAD8DW81_MYTSE|nr:hypothetical protein PYW07_001816 [Mythimna separata]